jgi:uncharacterized membrane protein YbhN (UPF0104 family)
VSVFLNLWEPVYVRRRVLSRLAISGSLVGVLIWRVNIGAALRTLIHVNYLYALPALILFTLAKFVFSVRWRVMLARLGQPPVRTLFGIMLVSNMANNVLPLRLGDVLRVQMSAQRYGISRSGLASSVFVTETLLDGVTFAILGLIGLALLDIPQGLRDFLWAMIGAAAAGLLLAILGAHISVPEGWKPGRWLAWLPERARQGIADIVPPFVEGMAALRHPRMGSRVLVLSFTGWLLEGLMFWLFGLGFGLHLSFGSYLVIMIAANVVISLPLAPSNVGPYEVAVAEVVAVLGVTRSLAGGYAIATHLLNIVWVGLTGLVAMWLLGLRFQDIFYLRAQASSPRRAPSMNAGASEGDPMPPP